MAEHLPSSATAAKLSQAIQHRTVSFLDHERIECGEFSRWEGFLREQFPVIHSKCTKTKLSDYAYVYHLQGSDPELQPVAYHAHFDVVPAEDSSEEWTHPPFAGEISDGFVWGRGAIDEKGLLISLWQALEELLGEGYTPTRSLYFCLGGDEEVGGAVGAKRIAGYLAELGVRFACLFDEGAFVTEGLVPGASVPVALIGTAEKGHLNVRLSVRSAGGHSSMPPSRTAVGILGEAVARLERHPFRLRITPLVASFFRGLSSTAGFLPSIVLKRPVLFAGLLKVVFSRRPETTAMLRTTQAPTVLRGSAAENVLPDRAEAVVNLRILHGDSIPTVIERIKRIVADPRVSIEPLPGSDLNDPVEATQENSWIYERFVESIREIFPDAVPVPFLVVGTTDSRHFKAMSDAILRFVPFRVDSELLSTMHNVNERVSIENLETARNFYRRLLRSFGET